MAEIIREINNVRTEKYEINGKMFARSYGKNENYIERDNVQYSEAIDPIEFAEERVYVETDIPIENENATSIDDVSNWTEIDAPREDDAEVM